MSSKKSKPAKKAKATKAMPAKSISAKNKGKDKKSSATNAKKIADKKDKQKIANKTSKIRVTEKKAVEKPKKDSGKKIKNSTEKLAIKKDKETNIKAKKGVEIAKIKADKAPLKPKRGRKKKSSGDDDDEPQLVDDILLEEILSSAKPSKKNTKEVKQIRTFVNPATSLTVAKTIQKSKGAFKEPNGKFTLEFVLGTSPGILYEFLTTPSGLSEWFADDVNIRDGVFTFFWDGSEQKALLLDFKDEKFIRFQWIDKPPGTYFEFKIEIDELTGDVSLLVTDFADEGSDLETSKRLWDSQIHTLMHVIGSY